MPAEALRKKKRKRDKENTKFPATQAWFYATNLWNGIQKVEP